MIRKLLLFVRSLLLLLSNSFKERSFTPSLRLICLGMFFVVSFANAANYYSRVATGNFATPGTWSTTPTGGANTTTLAPGDTFTIQNGHTITVAANQTVASVTISSGGTLIVGGFDFTVSGSTLVSGTITHNNTNGTKTFTGDVTINSGGIWNETVVEAIAFGGNLVNNGTFTASAGVHTFTGTTKTFSGSTTTIIPSVTISGTYSNNGVLAISTALSGTGTLTNTSGNTFTIGGTSAIATINNAGTANINGAGAITTVTLNNTGTLNLNGSGTIAIINNSAATSQLNIIASPVPTINTLTATAAGNTVNYNGTTQTIKGTTYSNLTLSNSGTKTLGANTTTGGALTVDTGVSLDMSTFLLTLNGNLINNGTGTITGTGTTGGVTITGTNTQSIAGFTTTGAVSMTKTGGVATLTGNVSAAALTINGTGGTLNLGTSLTNTFTGNISLTNGTLNGGSSTLNVNSSTTTAWNGTGTNFVAGTSTVNFGGIAQTISSSATTFYNLNLLNPDPTNTPTVTKTLGSLTKVTNLWTIAKQTMANLGAFQHEAGILTLGGVGPLKATWGSTASNPVAANTNDNYFSTTSGRITITLTPPGTAIDNNYAYYGTVGEVTGIKGEYEGDLTLTAPVGSIFINVKFASYGLPTGTAPNFAIGTCHASNSRTVTTGLLGNTSATIPPGATTYNFTFGDPCFGVEKKYYVTALYTTPVCTGSNPGPLIGSVATGGDGVNYAYLWEVSTTSATAGYTAAPGTNTGVNYTIPAGITTKTYYRRTVTSGIYSDETIVVIPVNTTAEITRPTTAVTTATSVCNGTSITLTATGGTFGTVGGYAEWTSGSCNGPLVGRSALTNGALTVTPTANTTYFVKHKNSCGETLCANNSITVTNPTSITVSTNTFTTCSTILQNIAIPYSATTGAPTRYNIVWSTAAVAAGFQNKSNVTSTFTTGSNSILNAITINASPTPGTYTGALTVQTGTACMSFETAITVTINPAPTLNNASQASAVCVGSAATINLTGLLNSSTSTISYTIGSTALTASVTASAAGTASFTTPALTAANIGQSLKITGITTTSSTPNCSGTFTQNFTLSINPTPTLSTASQATPVCIGSAATINLTGLLNSSTSTISYTIGSTALTASVTASATGTASFTTPALTVSNVGQSLQITGITTTSTTPNCSQTFAQNFTLSINPSPTLSTASQASTVCVGSAATINLTGLLNNSTSTISYTIGSTALTASVTASAAGTASFTTPALTASNVGQSLQITGITTTSSTPNCSQTFTQNFTLSINPSPSLSTASQASAVCVGSAATINLTGLLNSSTSTISYTIGSTALTASVTASAGGAASFTTPALTAANIGQSLKITGITTTSSTPNCSGTFTQNFTLSINPSPSLSTASQASAVCVGSAATINLTGLLNSSTSTISYTIGSTALTASVTASAAGTASFNTPVLTAANIGQSLKITGITTTSSTPNCSGTFTQNFTLSINPLPNITTQPQSAAVCAGKNHSFTIATSATSPAYQWQYSLDQLSWTNTNGVAGVLGHNTASLDLTNTPQAYSGYYVHCIITAGTCSSTSTAAQLTVNPTPGAPVASVTTQPTCVVSTGTITVTPVTGVNYSIDGSDYTNTTGIFPGVAVGSYNVTTRNSSLCISPVTLVEIYAYAAKKWTGAVSKDWNTAGNWDSNSVPGASDCIVIPDLTSIVNKPEITGTNNVFAGNSLTLNSNSSLKVASTNTLKITNSVNVDPTSSLTFESSSSLVQVSNTPNTGSITYKRNTAPVRRYDFTYWSSPVTEASGFTLNNLSSATLADKYYSYTPGTGWLIDYNGTMVMKPGQGYIVRAPQWFDINTAAIYNATFTGVPTNGDVPVKPAAGKWNLIGNPYPSAIDGRMLINNNGNVGSIYLWTHNSPPDGTLLGDKKYNYTTNDYAVMNGTGGIKTAGSAPFPTGYIAAGQAFFINAANGNDIIFTNSMRFGNNSDFYKIAEKTDVEQNRLWLNLTNAEGAFKQILVGYLEGATNSWDLNYDAATMNGNTFVDFYSINDGDKLTIQGRAVPFENTDFVPLGYKTSIAGDFTIAVDQGDGLFNNQDVYLEDKTTGTIQDLRKGNYTFTTAVGTFIDRFTLRYTNKTLGTGDFENIADGLLVSVKSKVIKVTSAKEQIKEISIFDITGKLLYNKKKVSTTEFSISNLQAADQVLLVKVTLENNFTTARKIIFN